MNMNFILPFALLLLGIGSSSAANEYAFTYVGDGHCLDSSNNIYDLIVFRDSSLKEEDCQEKCIQCTTQIEYVLIGVEHNGLYCICRVDDGNTFHVESVRLNDQCSDAAGASSGPSGTGDVMNFDPKENYKCWNAQLTTESVSAFLNE